MIQSPYAQAIGVAANIFPITAYGAVGDGATNNNSAFSKAIIAAVAAGGGVVFVPPGNFVITTKIDLATNVSLEGVGFNSIITTTQTGAGQPTVIRANNINNFAIRNLKIVGSGTAVNQTTYAVSITNGSYNGDIEYCHVSLAYLGIFIGDISSTSSYNITAKNNTIDNIGLNGIGHNAFSTGVVISQNRITNCGLIATISNLGAGIEFRSGSKAVISQNIIDDNNSLAAGIIDGIRLENDGTTPPSYITCIGNVINNFCGFGIRGQCVQNSTICNNVITGSTKSTVGILLYSSNSIGIGSTLNTVSANTIKNITGGRGIYLQGDASLKTTYNTITGNCIYNCNLGLSLENADYNCSGGNVLQMTTTGRGLYVLSGTGNSFVGDHAANCVSGMQIDGGSDNAFISCISNNNSNFGIFIGVGASNTVLQGGSFFSNPSNNIQNNSATSFIWRFDKNGIKFFGTSSPASQQLLPTSASASDIATALANTGLTKLV